MIPETQRAALKILSGIAKINRNEQVAFGAYIHDERNRPDLAEAGALCGGHQACLIGSAWLAAGAVPERRYGGIDLPTTYSSRRWQEYDRRPGLREAVDALDLAAEKYWGDTCSWDYWASRAEGLFEDAGSPWYSADRASSTSRWTRLRVSSRLVLDARKILREAVVS